MIRTLTTLLLALLGLPLLTACQDSPEGAVTAEAPELGDPAHYAPPGWPFQIGDGITERQFNQVRNEFRGYQGLDAIHAVDADVYSAQFRHAGWDDSDRQFPGSGRRWVYEGHFPGMLATPGERDEPDCYERLLLPPEYWGKIEYREAKPVSLDSRGGRELPTFDISVLLYGEPGCGKGSGE